MSTATNNRVADDDRSAREIERDIQRTRSEMDDTIDRLSEKLSPGNLLDSALGAFRRIDTPSKGDVKSSLKESGQSLTEVVKEHPAPFALCAAGLLWGVYEAAFQSNEPDVDWDDLGESSAELEEDHVPTWDERYDWSTSTYGSEDRWNEQAERSFSELSAASDEDDDQPGERIRSAASHVLLLSGVRRNDLARLEGRRRSEDWQRLLDCDEVASDYETSRSEELKEKASEAWRSVKESLSDASQTTRQKMRKVAETISEYASQAGVAAVGAKDSAVGGAGRLGRQVRSQSSSAARATRRGARQAGRSISSGAETAVQNVRQTADEYPLAAAGACFGIGLVAGLLAPASRYEDQWMGDASDDVSDAAREKAEEAARRGQQVAAETAHAALDEAERQGLKPEKISDAADQAAAAVSATARDALESGRQAAAQVKQATKNVAQETAATAKDEGEKHARQVRQS